jgi:hypothetical protein
MTSLAKQVWSGLQRKRLECVVYASWITSFAGLTLHQVHFGGTVLSLVHTIPHSNYVIDVLTLFQKYLGSFSLDPGSISCRGCGHAKIATLEARCMFWRGFGGSAWSFGRPPCLQPTGT